MGSYRFLERCRSGKSLLALPSGRDLGALLLLEDFSLLELSTQTGLKTKILPPDCQVSAPDSSAAPRCLEDVDERVIVQ
jgi:hypothetical protein